MEPDRQPLDHRIQNLIYDGSVFKREHVNSDHTGTENKQEDDTTDRKEVASDKNISPIGLALSGVKRFIAKSTGI